MVKNKKHIADFKKWYENKSGEVITDAQAAEYLERMVGFFQLLIDIEYRNKYSKTDSNQNQK